MKYKNISNYTYIDGWMGCWLVDRAGGWVVRQASVMWGVEWRDCGRAGTLTDDVGCFWIMIGLLRRDFLNNDGYVDTWVGAGFLGHN